MLMTEPLFLGLRADFSGSCSETRDTYRRRYELWRMFKVQLITGIRANIMLPLLDKLLLRRRVIVETIVDQLKNISQIEHSRHRSPVNFVVNVLCGLIAYCRKPSLNLAALAG